MNALIVNELDNNGLGQPRPLSTMVTAHGWHLPHGIIVVLGILTLLGGCGKKVIEPEPLDHDLVQSIKPGIAQADVEKLFGAPHEPSSVQAARINEVLQRMPERLRQDAEDHRTLAWGTDRGFLVAKVNPAGTIWIVSSHFGSASPSPLPPGPLPRGSERGPSTFFQQQ